MQAEEVVLNKESTETNNGGMRSVHPSVKADIENNVIKVDIKRFSGTALIYIYNYVGTPVTIQSVNVQGSSSSIIDVNGLEQGEYTLRVILCETTFSGSFNKD